MTALSDPARSVPAASAVVIGAGPAGLMAAETLAAAGYPVDVYDAMPSVARKLLIAGVGGLNLTHSEPLDAFAGRYREAEPRVREWLSAMDADGVRAWASGLAIDTFIGSSGRVFPTDMKAAPLLRAWLRRLRRDDVRIHPRHRWQGFGRDGALRFDTPDGPLLRGFGALVLALGGGSWARLGADGRWVEILSAAEIPLAPLRASNSGFDVNWSAHFRSRHAGAAVKPVRAALADDPAGLGTQGEFVVSEHGIEGSLIYALGADIRATLHRHGEAVLYLDLAPGRDGERLRRDLARPRNGRSLSEHLRRQAGIDGVKAGLLYEAFDREQLQDTAALARAIKSLPLRLLRARPLDEAISSAGGVLLSALDDGLMLTQLPGVFCAGEMLDWDAPTGGYLLTACFASGRVAGRSAAAWLRRGHRPVG